MDDKDSLKLLVEVLENVKNTTAKYPNLFYPIFNSFVDDLEDISVHIKNKNLRMCFLHLFVLNNFLQEYCDTLIRNKIFEQLKVLLNEEEIDEGLKEIVLGASVLSANVMVLGDSEGRDVIDLKRLIGGLKDELEGFDEETKAIVLSRMATSIRRIYDSFAEENSKEMIKFYDELIKATESNWTSVNDIINDYLMVKDNEAILWMREDI